MIIGHGVMGTSGKMMQDSGESDLVLFCFVFVFCTRNLSSPPRNGSWSPTHWSSREDPVFTGI